MSEGKKGNKSNQTKAPLVQGSKPIEKKSKGNKPSKKNLTPEDKKKRLTKSIMVSSVAVAAIMGITMTYFFSSDIPEKILATKIAWASTVDGPQHNVADDNDSDGMECTEDNVFVDDHDVGDFTITSVPGFITHVSGDEILNYLKEADDDVYEAFLVALHNASGSRELGDLLNSDEYQRHMAEAVEDGVARGKTLEEAYREAEALYPGEISADQRLSLIDELNAQDYMYYVAERGDTLIKLSMEFDVPLGQLVAINGIHDADMIPAGMIILFPLDTMPTDTPPVEAEVVPLDVLR